MSQTSRVIETVIRLTNEGEYRTALRNCNAELKNLKSGLDLTASAFRNNANSMEALSAKSSILNQTYDLQKQKVSTLQAALAKAQSTRDKEAEEVTRLRSEYAESQKTLSEYAETYGKQSQQYKDAEVAAAKLRDEIIKHSASLSSAEKSVSYYNNQLNKAQIELNDLDDKISENDRLMEEARQSADGCATSIDRYGDAVKQAADGTGASASAVDALASAMVAGGIQQKVEELAGAMMECVEASQNFDVAISKVYTLADESVISKGDMKTAIMEIASEMGKGAEEIGDAVYDALSAGVDTANVIDFVRQSTQLSIAGFTEAGTAVDVLTTILNAYRLEASQTEAIASKLVKTQDLGKITVGDLGKVMGRVIPTAAAYSVDLDNIATAYANMTASGNNAENTTAYLSTLLDELADSGSNVASILKTETGMSFSELMASGQSLGDVLGILSGSVDGNTTAFSNLWSSSTAGRGALALLNSGVEKFNNTLDEMASSSGAVAANYEKMASTSAYASQRVATASQNLKIAIGDQLNPVLDNLRNAGADALDVATDFVSRNPAVVAAVTGLVTALGTLATGLSALMVAKSVAAAMAALNISLAANPAILVATAVAGLGAALATLVSQTSEADEELKALTESSRTLAETVQSANRSYEDTVTSTNAAYEVVDGYVDRLAELEAQGLKTKDQQAEYATIVEKINATIPELNASINEQTGLLEGGTEALRAQAEQWQQTALQEAVYTRYKDDIAAMADAEYELAKNEKLLSSAQDERKAISADLAAAQERLATATDDLNGITNHAGESAEQYAARVREQRSVVEHYTDEVNRLTEAQTESQGKVQLYKEAVDDCNKAIEEQQPFVNAATEAWTEYSEQFQSMVETTEEGTEQLAESTSGSLEQLNAEYQQLKDSARQSLDQQIGLFEEVKLKCSQSTQDMIRSLQSQKKAFDDYATNINLAMERGIDQGLVQQLSDGSTESMAILAQLVTATDAEIAELNAAFLGASGAKDNLAGALTGMDKVVKDSILASKQAAYDSGYEVGTYSGQGYVDGINSKVPAASAAGRNLVNTTMNQARFVSRIESPSKRWKWIGEMEGEGYVDGHKKSIPKAKASATDLANAGYEAAIRSGQRNMQAMLRTSRQTVQTSGNADVLPMLRQILAAINAGKVLSLDGKALVGGTLGQYDRQMGQQQILAGRGAK